VKRSKAILTLLIVGVLCFIFLLGFKYEDFYLTKIYWLNAKKVIVTDFGATPDDKFFDDEAFSEAIKAVKKHGKGIIYVPQGVYLLSKPLFLPSNCYLIGEDIDKTVIARAEDFNEYLVINDNIDVPGFNGNKNIIVENLTLDDRREIVQHWGGGVGFAHAENVAVRNCRILNPYWHGIEFNAVNNGLIQGCEIFNAKNAAIQIDASTAEYEGLSGYAFHGLLDEKTPSKNIKIVGNSIKGFHYSGINFAHREVKEPYSNIIIEKNYLEGNSAYAAIHNEASVKNVVITGNIIISNVGIIIGKTIEDIEITQNQIYTRKGAGLVFKNPVKGLYFKDNIMVEPET